MTEQVTQDAVLNETEQQTPPALSVQDLVTLLNIIQLTSSRGAFRPEEFKEIGTVFEHLRDFLIASGAISVNAPQATQETQETQPEGN